MRNILDNTSAYMPIIALILLLIMIFSGKFFRDNWKAQGRNWKIKCWISGLAALASFMILAFVPLVSTRIY